MSLDKNDNLYMTVSKTGLVKFDGQKFYYLGHGQAVPTKYYLNYVDNDGHVWMNNDAGLTMFTEVNGLIILVFLVTMLSVK
ncbi:MAG: hypothetical protein IPN14_03970 [Bacteroidetes bacterium]|nr:hypothetical protein [Bacteroidota bacterium]